MINALAERGKHRFSNSTKERKAMEIPTVQKLQVEIAPQTQQDATTVFIVILVVIYLFIQDK